MIQKYSQLLEVLNLRQGLTEIAASAAKEASGAATKQVFAKLGSAALETVTAEVVKVIVGAVAGPLLRFLLNVVDTTSLKIDKIIRASFETGVREAKHALSLHCKSADEIQFRDQRLRFALDELERAWSLAENTRAQDQERFLIRLIQRLCAREMSGGGGYARSRLLECAGLLEKEAIEIPKRVKELDKNISDLNNKSKFFMDAAKASLPFAMDQSGSKRRYIAQSYKIDKEAKELQSNSEAMISKLAYLTDLIIILRGAS